MTKLTMSEPLIFDGEVSCWLIFGEKRALLLPKHGHFTEKEFTDAAKRLVKCWNAFEEDGLVSKLLAACKAWEKAIKQGDLGAKDLGSSLLAGEAVEKTKAAIAAAESED